MRSCDLCRNSDAIVVNRSSAAAATAFSSLSSGDTIQFMYKYGWTNRRLLFSAHVHVTELPKYLATTTTMMRHNMNASCSFQSGRLLLTVAADGVNGMCTHQYEQNLQKKKIAGERKRTEKRTIRYVLIATVPISHTTWMHELANQTKIRKIVFEHFLHTSFENHRQLICFITI